MTLIALKGNSGQILIGNPGSFPASLRQRHDVSANRGILRNIAGNNAVMAELRSKWTALFPGADARPYNNADLISAIDRRLPNGQIAMAYFPNNAPGGGAVEVGDRKGPVSTWSKADKVAEALERIVTKNYVGGELLAMVRELVSPMNIAIMVGFIVAVAAAHLLGAPGAAIDAVLIGIAWASAGWAGIQAVMGFIKTTIHVVSAKTDADIDQAAQEYAHAFRLLGTAFLARFLAKAKTKQGGGSTKPKPKTSAPPPAPPKPPVKPKTPAPPPKPPVKPPPPTIGLPRSQLQHGFKHAKDFGVNGNPNNKTLAEFGAAIESHVSAPATKVISGTYRGQPVTHFVDPGTGLNVIRDASGNFLSGWKLSPAQLGHVLNGGKLGGG
jgi:hypothetical protein